MRKKLFFAVVLLLCLGGSLSALDIFAGVGPEINAYTREGFALGANLLVGIGINPQMAAGIKAGFFHNLDTVSALDVTAFYRYYLPLPVDGFFAQLDVGSVILFEFDESFPAVSGGLNVGWRYNISSNWYIEPAARFGYPYIWAVGLTAGYVFPIGDE